MTEKSRIDVHCHFFNLSYAVREILDVTRLHAAPLQIEKTHDDKIRQVIRWFLGLLPAIFGSCEDHFNLLQAAFSKSALKPTQKLVTVPLMMDIHFLLKNYIYGEATGAVAGTSESDLKKQAQTIEQIVMDEIDTYVEKTLMYAAAYDLVEVKDEIKKIADEFVNKDYENCTPDMSWGYWVHFKELKELQKNNPGSVFPFLAVDPRREGILEIVNKNVTKTGPFYGIKLYTRLGYRATHETLYPIYDYCIDKDLPIIVHCSDGGFPPGENWKYKDYAAPKEWEPIFKQKAYKDLRVDFAHFGKQDQKKEEGESKSGKSWIDEVVDLMKPGNNVYADLAFYPDPKSLETIKTKFESNEIVTKRLMFGTDYIMVALKTDLMSYFGNFAEIFYPKDLDALMSDNPKTFLNIDGL